MPVQQPIRYVPREVLEVIFVPDASPVVINPGPQHFARVDTSTLPTVNTDPRGRPIDWIDLAYLPEPDGTNVGPGVTARITLFRRDGERYVASSSWTAKSKNIHYVAYGQSIPSTDDTATETEEPQNDGTDTQPDVAG